MRIPISRRDTILMACLTGVAASVAPLQAAPLSFKVGPLPALSRFRQCKLPSPERPISPMIRQHGC